VTMAVSPARRISLSRPTGWTPAGPMSRQPARSGAGRSGGGSSWSGWI
jgi:hypothetical protein